MSKPGPRPTPTKLKLLTGNPGKRPLNTNEPEFEPGDVAPPGFLDDRAVEEWKRLASSMVQLGLLSKGDRMTFAAYCQSVSDYQQACEHIRKYGTITKNGRQIIPSPFVSMRNRALQNVRFMAQEFGLTASARSRISIESGNTHEDAFDAWQQNR